MINMVILLSDNDINILILMDTDKLIEKLKDVWHKLTDIYNRDLHITKESSLGVDRGIEMMLFRLNEKIPSIRTELEKILDILKERKIELRTKIIK